MKLLYRKLEIVFEKFAQGFIRIYGHPVSFVIAVIVVLVYLFSPKFYNQDMHSCIRDLITCITFLIFFIIQKTINKNSTVTQIKINELIASNEKASTRLVNIEEKTEKELKELADVYKTLSKEATSSGNTHSSASIDLIEDKYDKEDS